MQNLSLHPKTKRQLELTLDKQPQVIILSGNVGVGLYTIAHNVALKISDKHNILPLLPDDKGTIKIDTVRQLYDHTRAKRNNILVILIDNAEEMLAPAQNALLKLLEDTPKNTVFILTTHHPQLILPTIHSRAQHIEVLPLSTKQTLELVNSKNVSKDKQPQILFLAAGLPAELHRLSEDKDYLAERARQMGQAKAFLEKPLYEKLVLIYTLPADRSAAFTLLQDIMHIAKTTLVSHPKPRVAKLLDSLLETEHKLYNDGHVRTQLLNLAVHIG
jgi:DNA polymerase III delta prime subunit